MENRIAELAERLEASNSQQAPLTTARDKQNIEETGLTRLNPPKGIMMVVEGTIVNPLRAALNKRLPKRSPLTVRASPKPDIETILAETHAQIAKILGPICLFLRAGYHECMEFEKKRFIKALLTFASKLREERSDIKLHILLVPLFNSDCKAANDALPRSAKEENAPFPFVHLSMTHRPLVESGRYHYSGEIVSKVAHNICRRIRFFIGVKCRAPKQTPNVMRGSSSPVNQPHIRGEANHKEKPNDQSQKAHSRLTTVREMEPFPKNHQENREASSQRKGRSRGTQNRVSMPPAPTIKDCVNQVLAAVKDRTQPRRFNPRNNGRAASRGHRRNSAKHPG